MPRVRTLWLRCISEASESFSTPVLRSGTPHEPLVLPAPLARSDGLRTPAAAPLGTRAGLHRGGKSRLDLGYITFHIKFRYANVILMARKKEMVILAQTMGNE